MFLASSGQPGLLGERSRGLPSQHGRSGCSLKEVEILSQGRPQWDGGPTSSWVWAPGANAAQHLPGRFLPHPAPQGTLARTFPSQGLHSQEGPHLPEGKWLQLMLRLALCSSLSLDRHFSSVPGVRVTRPLVLPGQ